MKQKDGAKVSHLSQHSFLNIQIISFIYWVKIIMSNGRVRIRNKENLTLFTMFFLAAGIYGIIQRVVVETGLPFVIQNVILICILISVALFIFSRVD